MNYDKVLIAGYTGKAGEAITRQLLRETMLDLVLVTSSDYIINDNPRIKQYKVDYRDFKTLRSLYLEHMPYWIVNAVAFTNVDLCEEKRKDCMDLNYNFVKNLAQLAKTHESHLITFSTDYIFDGKEGPYSEDAKPNPINYYGKSKLASENACLAIAFNHTIIRTNIIYGASMFGKTDFIYWLANILKEGKRVNVIDGQWGNPTLSDDIGLIVNRVIEKNRNGIYNAAGKDWLNRYEIAVKTAEVYGFNKNLINKVPSDFLKQKARRPEKGGLITLKSETDLNMRFTSLSSGLLSLKNYYLD